MRDYTNLVWQEADPVGGSLATGAAETPPEPPKETPPPELPDWVETFPDDLKKTVSRYKTPEELAKAYKNIQSQMGKSAQIPGKDSSEEEWNSWYKRIGRPDSSDGYELSNIERPANLPEDKDGAMQKFAESAHKDGLTKEQTRRAWTRNLEQASALVKAIGEARKNAVEAAETSLRNELGTEYNPGVQLMKRVVNRFADKDAVKALDEGLGNDSRLIRMLINIGKVMSEDTLAGRLPSERTEETPEPGVFQYDHSPGMTGEQRFGRMRR